MQAFAFGRVVRRRARQIAGPLNGPRVVPSSRRLALVVLVVAIMAGACSGQADRWTPATPPETIAPPPSRAGPAGSSAAGTPAGESPTTAAGTAESSASLGPSGATPPMSAPPPIAIPSVVPATPAPTPAPTTSPGPRPSAPPSPEPSASAAPSVPPPSAPPPSIAPTASPLPLAPTATPRAIKDPGEAEDASLTGYWPTVIFEGDADWQIQRPSTVAHPTEAFTDAPSYLPGGTLRLAVNTDSPTYTVAIFRVGATVQSVTTSSPQRGVLQPVTITDPATKMVVAPWPFAFSMAISANWPSGLYLAKVSGTGGTQSYAPFVIRSTRASRFLFVSNVLNNQAYNTWGGSSLYWSGIGDPAPGVHRAFAVSLDRPFEEGDGAGQVFTMEAPFINWLEHSGYDVAYTTDYDLSLHSDDQPLPSVVLFSGHDEYWGTGLRDWLDEHVIERGDLGLGVFAADTGYWQVSFRDESPTGPRTIVLYKNGLLDPEAAARCPDGVFQAADAFRGWPCGRREPANRPEQALFGVQYGAMAPGYNPYRLASTVPDWLVAGTGLNGGDSLGRLAGGEVDNVDATFARPDGNQIVATASCPTAYGTREPAQAALRRTPAGGRVFASGTFWWTWGLEPRFASAQGVPDGFEHLTRNILAYLATP